MDEKVVEGGEGLGRKKKRRIHKSNDVVMSLQAPNDLTDKLHGPLQTMS